METIPAGLSILLWSGPDTPLANVPGYAAGARAYDISPNGLGLVTAKFGAQFPAFDSFRQGHLYLVSWPAATDLPAGSLNYTAVLAAQAAQAASAAAQLQMAQQQVGALSTQVAGLQTDNATLAAQVAAQGQDIAAKAQQIVQLMADKAAQSQTIADLQAQLAAAQGGAAPGAPGTPTADPVSGASTVAVASGYPDASQYEVFPDNT